MLGQVLLLMEVDTGFFYSLRHGLGQHYLGSAALAHNQHPSFKSFSLPCKRRGLLPRRKLMLSCYIFFRLYLIATHLLGQMRYLRP